MPDLGALYRDGVTTFRVWAPDHARVELVLEGDIRPLVRDARGYWTGRFTDVPSGALYRYRLNGSDAHVFPDPASRSQPQGVHGPSQVIDPFAFRWTDDQWEPPPLNQLVIYELHVGTFSPQGTFRGVIDRLPSLVELGVTAIELMPIGDFPGERNWGYDGVAIFAPARCYGAPDDLRALVDAAHRHGLAVLLDVVYNHFGPDGAYANAFSSHYFTEAHSSPWGAGVNLDGPHSPEVRRFFFENALHWAEEYHVDGLRLDATHALQDDGPRHFLAELTSTLRQSGSRPLVLMAEDHRNITQLVEPEDAGGFGLDAIWADDLHHQTRVHLAGDQEGYYADFSGSTDDLATTLRQGWFFVGQHSHHLGTRRGTDPTHLAPPQFVICIQNHDQVGNRADGARLHHEVDLAAYRAACVLLLLAPQTPLLFMGQEWAASSPFLFFTDHHEVLGRAVTKGRREEFGAFAAFADPSHRERIPDPQALGTFERSRLDWSERLEEPHAGIMRLHQHLLALRTSHPALAIATRSSYAVRAADAHTVTIARNDGATSLLGVVRLSRPGCVTLPILDEAAVVLTTEDADVTADPRPIVCADGSARFERPGALVAQYRGPRLAL